MTPARFQNRGEGPVFGSFFLVGIKEPACGRKIYFLGQTRERVREKFVSWYNGRDKTLFRHAMEDGSGFARRRYANAWIRGQVERGFICHDVQYPAWIKLRAKTVASASKVSMRRAIGLYDEDDFDTPRPIASRRVYPLQIDRTGSEVAPPVIGLERRERRRPIKIEIRFRFPANHPGEDGEERRLPFLTPP